MKRTLISAVFLFCVFMLAYFAFSPKNFLENKNHQKSQNDHSENPQIASDNNKIVFNGLISSVKFVDCEIIVTSTDGKEYTLGKLAASGMNNTDCILKPKYEISDSGKYLIFEDVSGGIDLWIRVFSVQTKSIDTIGVWGTSSLLDLEFLFDDKIAILSGYPDIPNEQWLNVYNLPALYSNYPENIDAYNYFKWDLLNSNKTKLPIKATPGNYYKLSKNSTDLILYGGTESNQIVRGSFPLKTL